MARHFHEELDALKQTILAMGGLVEDQIRRVMRALIERDGDLAQEVIDRDRQVNAYDVEIDEKCVELLALHQPAAGDLRFITTAMKIVTDLERIGDQAVNIAQRAIELNREPQLKPYVDLPRMTEKAQRDQHRRDGDLHGREQDGPAHSRVRPHTWRTSVGTADRPTTRSAMPGVKMARSRPRAVVASAIRSAPKASASS